jgi:hypothetical protein
MAQIVATVYKLLCENAILLLVTSRYSKAWKVIW